MPHKYCSCCIYYLNICIYIVALLYIINESLWKATPFSWAVKNCLKLCLMSVFVENKNEYLYAKKLFLIQLCWWHVHLNIWWRIYVYILSNGRVTPKHKYCVYIDAFAWQARFSIASSVMAELCDVLWRPHTHHMHTTCTPTRTYTGSHLGYTL